jgi:hypothetical protein
VDNALLEEIAPNGLTGTALEEDVVWHDDGGSAVILSRDFTCWTKLSCLFEVVVQKSGRCR